MKESTLIVEKHRWRGFKTVGGELGMARTVGFLTFTYCPFLLSVWIEAKLDLMRGILRTQPGANASKNTVRDEKFPLGIHTTRKSQ